MVGIGAIELRRTAERRASKVGVPFTGRVHMDPLTGDSVRRIQAWRSGSVGPVYPPRVPYSCDVCVGYPCECGTAGEGC